VVNWQKDLKLVGEKSRRLLPKNPACPKSGGVFGKSAILEAVEYGFLGKLPHRGVKTKKDAPNLLSTNGQGGMAVEIETSVGILKRGKTAKVPPTGLDDTQLGAILSARRVLSMAPKERQAVFSALFMGDFRGPVEAWCKQNEVSTVWTKRIVANLDPKSIPSCWPVRRWTCEKWIVTSC
jgi:hypothetical protein